jgi:SPP1 gp7 family putative phage head morphogenesis protein
MNNQDYWAQRFRYIENIEHSTAVLGTEDIQGLLAAACSQIDKEVNAFYQKYADQSGMTLADAEKYLQRTDLLEFKSDLKDYTRMAMNNSDGQFENILNALSARAHVQRLEALKIRAAMAVRTAYGQADARLAEICGKIMQDAHLRTAYEVQRGIGKYEPFQQIGKKELSMALKKPWTADGKTFSSRIWAHQQQLTANLQQEFVRGFISGTRPKEMTKNIVSVFGVAERAASRLVQTESSFFAAAGDREAYGDLGIEKYQILVTLDERTCEICADYDGQTFSMAEYSPGDTAPPFHADCRCTTIPVVTHSATDADETRAARDENGRTIQVEGEMTYEDWKSHYVRDD